MQSSLVGDLRLCEVENSTIEADLQAVLIAEIVKLQYQYGTPHLAVGTGPVDIVGHVDR